MNCWDNGLVGMPPACTAEARIVASDRRRPRGGCRGTGVGWRGSRSAPGWLGLASQCRPGSLAGFDQSVSSLAAHATALEVADRRQRAGACDAVDLERGRSRWSLRIQEALNLNYVVAIIGATAANRAFQTAQLSSPVSLHVGFIVCECCDHGSIGRIAPTQSGQCRVGALARTIQFLFELGSTRFVVRVFASEMVAFVSSHLEGDNIRRECLRGDGDGVGGGCTGIGRWRFGRCRCRRRCGVEGRGEVLAAAGAGVSAFPALPEPVPPQAARANASPNIYARISASLEQPDRSSL